MGSSNRLFRYTTIPVLLDVLRKRHITLLSPATWTDRNNAYVLDQYRLKIGLGRVLAVCFTTGGETFHHWEVFSSGSSGVCMEFDKERLLKSFAEPGFRHRLVDYRLIKTLQKNAPDPSIWPFLKRKAFKDEKEYGIIYQSADEDLHEKPVSIDLTSIKSVIFSPKLPTKIEDSVMNVVRSIDGCTDIKLRTSRLLDNARWRAVFTQEIQ